MQTMADVTLSSVMALIAPEDELQEAQTFGDNLSRDQRQELATRKLRVIQGALAAMRFAQAPDTMPEVQKAQTEATTLAQAWAERPSLEAEKTCAAALERLYKVANRHTDEARVERLNVVRKGQRVGSRSDYEKAARYLLQAVVAAEPKQAAAYGREVLSAASRAYPDRSKGEWAGAKDEQILGAVRGITGV